jgi:hypothetical protein
MNDVTIFAGPSAFGLDRFAGAPSDLRWQPPVRRGDIDRLIGERDPGVVILCDGVFQSQPAVSHAELCRALDAGWQAWGVSSMGAIRAHEMRFEGMHGFGYVHEQFKRFQDFTDDEVTLLHFPEPPYFPVSEALVNVRYALEHKGIDMGMPVASRRRVVDRLRSLWFGDRVESQVRKCLMEEAATTGSRADEFCEWMKSNRIKTMDLAALLNQRPWLAPVKRPRRSPAFPTGTAPRRQP